MTAPYTITALLTPKNNQETIQSRTPIERHRNTHRAGIPEFTLTQQKLIAVSIHFIAKPDPIDPQIPNPEAQEAALRQLRAEIIEHYPGAKPKFKLYQNRI